MEKTSIDYDAKTKVELVALCKERGVKGYAQRGITKANIIHNIFRTVRDKKHMLNCPECIIPRSNKRTLQINGITYKSIIYFCTQKNIPKTRLYTKMNQGGIDYTVIANIQTFIEANLDILTRK